MAKNIKKLKDSGKKSLDEYKTRLKELANSNDPESAHCEANKILLDIIDDSEISDLFNKIKKWYA